MTLSTAVAAALVPNLLFVCPSNSSNFSGTLQDKIPQKPSLMSSPSSVLFPLINLWLTA